MVIDYNIIPDLMFLPAVLKKDIRKAIMIPMEDREPGGPDILLESPLGFKDSAPRQKVVEVFRYNNGKKIKLGAWKKGDGNMVVADSNDTMYAIYIPPGYEMVIPTEEGNRRLSSSGVYLVCADDGEGSIDRDSVFIISPKFFRKMFCMTGSIMDNAEQCEELQMKIIAKIKKEQSLSEESTGNELYSDDDFEYREEIEEEAKKLNEAEEEELEDEIEDDIADEDNTELKYEAIARIVQAEKNIGFLMVGIDGQEIRVTKKEILELARNRHINNVGIRVKDGKEYLYGIGIKLSELPEVD